MNYNNEQCFNDGNSKGIGKILQENGCTYFVIDINDPTSYQRFLIRYNNTSLKKIILDALDDLERKKNLTTDAFKKKSYLEWQSVLNYFIVELNGKK